MTDHSPRRSKFNSVNVEEVHTNVSQEIIEITSDKLKLILNEHIESLEKSKEWQTPLSLILTIALVLSTTNFKSSFGVPPETWLAIFILSCGLSILWLIKTIVRRTKAMTVEDILKIAKNQKKS